MELTRRNFVLGSGVTALGLGLVACGGGDGGSETTTEGSDDKLARIASAELIEAAKQDGALVIYGSCEEDHVAACANHFKELFPEIDVQFQRLSTGEVESKIEEEKGNPSADVWFGGTTDPYNVAVTKGLLEPYAAANADHIIDDKYKDADGNWYGIYKGILGFMVDTEELERLGLDAPKTWDDLLDSKY